MGRWGDGSQGEQIGGEEGGETVCKIKGKNVNFKKEVKHSTLQQRQGMF